MKTKEELESMDKLVRMSHIANLNTSVYRKQAIILAKSLLKSFSKPPNFAARSCIGRLITAISEILEGYSRTDVGYYNAFQELLIEATRLLLRITNSYLSSKNEVDYNSHIKLNLHGEFTALISEKGEVHLYKGQVGVVALSMNKVECLCGIEAEAHQVDPSKHHICENCLEIVFEYLMAKSPWRDNNEKELVFVDDNRGILNSYDAYPLDKFGKNEGLTRLLYNLACKADYSTKVEHRFYKARKIRKLRLVTEFKLLDK